MERYTVTIEAYVYAENDKAAKAEAQRMASEMRDREDNHACVTELHQIGFGELKSRKAS